MRGYKGLFWGVTDAGEVITTLYHYERLQHGGQPQAWWWWGGGVRGIT